MIKLNTDNEIILANNYQLQNNNLCAKKVCGTLILTTDNIVYNYDSNGNAKCFEQIKNIDVYVGNASTSINQYLNKNNITQIVYIITTDTHMSILGKWFPRLVYDISDAKTIVYVSISYIIYIDTHDSLNCLNIINYNYEHVDTNNRIILDTDVIYFFYHKNYNLEKKIKLIYQKSDGTIYVAEFKWPNLGIINVCKSAIIPYKCANNVIIDWQGRIHKILDNADNNFVTEIDNRFDNYKCDDITIYYYDSKENVVYHTTDNKFVDVNTAVVLAENCITERKKFGKKA
jgi:rRNA-processing protein FCF1